MRQADAQEVDPIDQAVAVGVAAQDVDSEAEVAAGRAVAGSEEIVRAEENFFGPKLAEFREELLAVLHVGVVRFVRAEEAPDRF